MTTTDPTPLQERLARAIRSAREFRAGAAFGIPEEAREQAAGGLAAAVLPIVAEEVRAAKAEAWDECEESAYFDPDCRDQVGHDTNPYREAGDSDEHR